MSRIERNHSGWLLFAGVMLILLGSLNLMDGYLAVFHTSWYAVNEVALLIFNYEAWGWLFMATGAVQLGLGIAVIKGSSAARMGGVVVAALNLVSQVAYMEAYPIWSTVGIVLDVVVIYGLTVGSTSATHYVSTTYATERSASGK